MIRYLKPVIFILFCILNSSFIYGQRRVVNIDDITGKFNQYCNDVPREEIYIHTDREDYIAGEEMWFNVYVVDRQSSKPSPYSRIVYIELMNRYNNPVLQKRILIENGSGPGQVVLPDSLSSGNYTLRAYTNWMKNFLPANCFMKDINIYNTFSSRAFKVKPGYKNLTPESPVTRRAIRFADDEFTLETTKSGSGDLEVAIHTNDVFRLLYGNVYYLIMQTHGIINFKNTVRISSDNTTVNIPGQNILHGINHITLFEATGVPVFEKFIYTPAKNKKYLTVDAYNEYERRDKISLDISINTEIVPSTELVNLSLSVVPETGGFNSGDIDDYMVFGTEFGIIPDNIKNKKLDEIDPGIMNQFLSTLKSNWIDWDVILFDNIPSYKYGIEKDSHFLTGNLINRSTLKGDGGKYIFLSTPSKTASLQYALTDTTGKFVFGIPIVEGVSDLIIQTEKVIRNNAIKMESSFSEVVYPFEGSGFSDRETPAYVPDMSAHYQVGEIYGTSYIGSTLQKTIALGETKRFYGKPDIELVMDDYIKLPVMPEVFFELLPGVFMRKRKSEYKISIYNSAEDRIFDKPPGLFIDGILINDPALIANLDPDLVERIDIVKDVYFIDDYFFFGIINVITEAGDFSNVALPDHAIRLPYRVTEPVNTFLSPDYSAQESMQNRIPDFRNTLYWNPSVKTGTGNKISIEFCASDLPGDYMLDIQGITAQGDKISLKKIIRIN
jgi:hypothetical protein